MIRGLRIASLLFTTCFVLTACGGGGGGSSFLGGGGTSGGGGSPTGTLNSKGNVQFTLTIPGAGSGSSSSTTSSAKRIVSSSRTPQTVSPNTQSITVSVNGGTPQVFNVSSCTGTTTLTCTLNVGAPFGNDSFLILTFSGTSGTGSILNAAAVSINVTQGGTNTASATAGTAIQVNSSSDGSDGSFSCASGSTTCTLREAVAEASTAAGAYTALLFATGITSIAVTSPIQINGQNIIIIGPGALVSNTNTVGAPSASSNLTISGGGNTQILNVESGSLFVDGVTLSNGNAADNSGGAIENDGTLAIANTVFSSNGGANTYYGGAVYDAGAAPSTIASSTFNNNSAQYYGGAYYDDAGATFTHTLFNGNAAFSGSGFTSGGAIYADWNLAVDSSTFTANVAGSQTASGIEGEGGAISIVGASVNPSITNSTFGGSSASAGNFAGGTGSGDDGYGGAIYNGGPASLPLTFSGNTFSNNVAKGGDEAAGGAIWDDRGITSTSDTFTSNVADGTAATSESDAYAGAIYDESALSFTTDTFTGNQALGGNSTYGEGGAGAVYAEYQLSVTQTTFSNNTVSGSGEAYGGALYADDDSGDTLAFSNVQFTNNSATSALAASPQYGPDAEGGALEIGHAAISMQNVTISGNTATASGNATYVGYAYGGGFEYYDGDEEGCGQECSVARKPFAALATQVPASVKAAAAGVAKRASSFASLKTRRTNATMRVNALALTRVAKKAKHRAAAIARYSTASTPNRTVAATRRTQSGPANGLDTVTFSNNIADGGLSGYAYGGGAEFSGDPTTNAITFSGNIARVSGPNGSADGGGFTYGDESSCETFTFTGAVTNNSATNEGGGIWNTCGTLIVQSSTISGNSVTATAFAGDGGGGLWNYEDLYIIQSLVTGNSVAGSVASTGGGGLTQYEGYASIVNSTFFGNTSSIDGGGIENVDYSEVDLNNATIYGNKATGNGGNVSNDPYTATPGDTTVYLTNSILGGGSAANGSDIWNLDTVISQGYNVVQQSSNFGTGTANTSPNSPQTGDLIGTNPLMAASVTNTGGPTATLADTSASPGKGHIPFASGMCNNVTGTAVDQRGYARGAGGVCDSGAYEFSGTPVTQGAAQSVRSILSAMHAHH